MKIYDFAVDKQLSFLQCGKFQSPNASWMHYKRELTEFEFMFVTEGTLYIADGDTRYMVSKGEYLLMQPTLEQYGYEASDCSFYWLHFSYNDWQNNPVCYQAPSEAKPAPGHLLLPEHEVLSSADRLLVLTKQLLDSDMRYHEELLSSALLLAVLAETACQSTLLGKYSIAYSGDQLYNDLYEFIRMHASENIPVSEIATYFNYSQTYLTSFFHKRSGFTMKQFILQCKIEIAKAELSDTNHSITQVAYNIGFDDVHNFSNAFKKIVGVSPLTYRNSFAKRWLNNR